MSVNPAFNLGRVEPSPRHSWHRIELSPWQEPIVDLTQRLSAVTTASTTILMFDVREGRVTIREKGGEWAPLDNAAPFYEMMRFRGEVYRRFIEESLERFGNTHDGSFAIELGDLAEGEADIPVFCFQKPRGSARLLLPDLDSLILDFYEQPDFSDATPFDAKLRKAIFVGSTTGSLPLTQRDVVEGRNARIRSAQYFKDHPIVDFFLPSVVQCDGAETSALIEGLGIAGRRFDWSEQFGYRYLLSLDGNGATCSRVAIALRSQSVLIKYRSLYELHYFKGLVDGEHLVSVADEVEAAERAATMAAYDEEDRVIAAKGRSFALANLSRLHMMRYAADLLNGYLDRFGTPRGKSAIAPSAFILDVAGHFDDGQSRWADRLGRVASIAGERLTGISVYVDDPLQPKQIESTLIDDRGETHIVVGGGPNDLPEGRVVHGISVRLRGRMRTPVRVFGQIWHADGSVRPMGPDGVGPPAGSAIIGFAIGATPRRVFSVAMPLWLREISGAVRRLGRWPL